METTSREIDLVRRAREQDANAFEDLVRAYQRRAVSVAYRLLGNIDDASDVSQDAFVRAYRCLGQLDDAARFGPWLMRIVTNLSLNFRRGRKSRATTSLDDAVLAVADAESAGGSDGVRSDTSGQGAALSKELDRAIGVAVGELPEKQRLALILFSVEGMPQREVAEILDCSVELVKWNVFQARKKLKESLSDYL